MKVNVDDYRNVLFCGDVHGQLDFLLSALNEMGYDEEQDLLITTGDTIDRGENSLGTLLYFLDAKKNRKGIPSKLSTRGNHEDFGIDICFYGNKDWEQDWFKYGGAWTKSYDSDYLKEIFGRVKNEFPLYLDVYYKEKHIVVSHAAIPGYNYDRIQSIQDKELVKNWLIHKQETLPVNEEEEIYEDLEIVGADLSIHGHTIVSEPYLYKNRLYIDTGCIRDSGISEGNKNSLTILKLSNTEGISIQSFKTNEFLKGIEWVDSKVNESAIEERLTKILIS